MLSVVANGISLAYMKKRRRIALSFAHLETLRYTQQPPQTELFCKCVIDVLAHAKYVLREMTPCRVFLVKLKNENAYVFSQPQDCTDFHEKVCGGRI